MKDVGIQFEFATISDGRLLAQTMWNELLIAALQAPLQQAAQGEPAEHWHRLYLEKCQQYNDRVAQLGAEIEGLEEEAAQGAGEVVAWQASDGGSSYISNEARSRNSAFRELYTNPLYTQPAAGADVNDTARLDALARPGWELSMNNEPECGPDELWQVHRVSGGRNDREWTLIGEGTNPRAAIDAAIAASGRQG